MINFQTDTNIPDIILGLTLIVVISFIPTPSNAWNPLSTLRNLLINYAYRCTGVGDDATSHASIELEPAPASIFSRTLHTGAGVLEAVVHDEVQLQTPPAVIKALVADIIAQIFSTRNSIPLPEVVTEVTAHIIAQELLGIDISNERSNNTINTIKHALDFSLQCLPDHLRLRFLQHTQLSYESIDGALRAARALRTGVLQELVTNDRPRSHGDGIGNIIQRALGSFYLSVETAQRKFVGFLRRVGRSLAGHATGEVASDLERGQGLDQEDGVWLTRVVKGVVCEVRRICELIPPPTGESGIGAVGGGWMARIR